LRDAEAIAERAHTAAPIMVDEKARIRFNNRQGCLGPFGIGTAAEFIHQNAGSDLAVASKIALLKKQRFFGS
jgi:hypothetical protein